jgi:hypothetical protein
VCHQSVGLIVREVEAAGIPTLCMTSAYDITQAVNPPRAVFLNYPLGHQTGKPNDSEGQRAIIRDALGAFETNKQARNDRRPALRMGCERSPMGAD